MVVQNSRNVVLLSLFVVLVGGYWWINRGYGEVSPKTYEFSKSLYSACLKKSEEHLGKVEEMLNEVEGDRLSSNERVWLKQMIELARNGRWESAASKARQMMEDQLEY